MTTRQKKPRRRRSSQQRRTRGRSDTRYSVLFNALHPEWYRGRRARRTDGAVQIDEFHQEEDKEEDKEEDFKEDEEETVERTTLLQCYVDATRTKRITRVAGVRKRRVGTIRSLCGVASSEY